MKVKISKTGEIKAVNHGKILVHFSDGTTKAYDSISGLSDDLEDYEEPKGTALYWMILTLENFIENEPDDKWVDLEDCKKMLEKLKAWERLRGNGLKITGYGKWAYDPKSTHHIDIALDYVTSQDSKDLNLLFGGGE